MTKIGGSSLISKQKSKNLGNASNSNGKSYELTNDLILTKSTTNLSGFGDQSHSEIIQSPKGRENRILSGDKSQEKIQQMTGHFKRNSSHKKLDDSHNNSSVIG